MEYLVTVQRFVEKLNEREGRKICERKTRRFQELAGILELSGTPLLYTVQITLVAPISTVLLFEHDLYHKFQKTNNRFTYHPENPGIPVKAHYHVYPSNSKKELYAVNVADGTAHHKKNKGLLLPRKEADELRALGVQIPSDNILETKQSKFIETSLDKVVTFFIILEE